MWKRIFRVQLVVIVLAAAAALLAAEVVPPSTFTGATEVEATTGGCTCDWVEAVFIGTPMCTDCPKPPKPKK